MVSRRGSSSLGCLSTLAVLSALAYVAVHVSEPYFKYYRFRDAVTQEARFASLRTDDAIRQDIWANADSLALPEGAYHARIKRTTRTIAIDVEYDDSWSVLSYERPVHFAISVRHDL